MKVTDAAREWGLHQQIATNLITELGVVDFFPVQLQAIPLLVRQNAFHCVVPQDICCSAPTGSGKTIAYCVPIIQTLLQQQNEAQGSLRALVLLPSRELAAQVFDVMKKLAVGTSLQTCLITGQRDFFEEQSLLMGPYYQHYQQHRNNDDTTDPLHSTLDRRSTRDALHYNADWLRSGRSGGVDVLVCTSGRLLEHLQFTRGFSLRHLRFLVLDEADRLLGNAYHSWVRIVLRSATDEDASLTLLDEDTSYVKKSNATITTNTTSNITSNTTAATTATTTTAVVAVAKESSGIPRIKWMRPPLQRLLFSATLTDNPSKLALLGIYSPLLIRVGNAADTITSTSEYTESTAATATAIDTAVHATADGSEDEDVDSVDDEAEEIVATTTTTTAAAAAAVSSGFTLPRQLTEAKMICDSANKPAKLIAILLEAFAQWDDSKASIRTLRAATTSTTTATTTATNDTTSITTGAATTTVTSDAVTAAAVRHLHRASCSQQRALCIVFTSSVEETHRLYRLLQIVNGEAVLGEINNNSSNNNTNNTNNNSYNNNSNSNNSSDDSAVQQLVADIIAKLSDPNESISPTTKVTAGTVDRPAKKRKRDTSRSVSAVAATTTATAAATTTTAAAQSQRLLFGGRVTEMSRIVAADRRESEMHAARAGEVSVIVCSDQLSRGIDLPNISLVVNYEPPKHAKTYVHRVGRTARAGKSGHCITLVHTGQVGFFRKLRAEVQGTTATATPTATYKEEFERLVAKCSVRTSTEELLLPVYNKALSMLPQAL